MAPKLSNDNAISDVPPSPSPLMPMVLPVTIGSVSLFLFSQKLDSGSQIFWNWEVKEQVAFVALVCSVVFAAVAASHAGDTNFANLKQANLEEKSRHRSKTDKTTLTMKRIIIKIKRMALLSCLYRGEDINDGVIKGSQ